MIPAHVVTGFLGAGKTTFLNRLLRDPALAGALVVVNEFGEAALDHRLYERFDGEIALLASGCLCCALRGDFVDGLNALFERRDGGEIAFDRLVVETSGLADPGPILHALFADPRLAARLRLVNVTTLIDAANGAATLAAHGEARRQAWLADRLALTKLDLADAAPARAALEALGAPGEIVAAADLDALSFLTETARLRDGLSSRAVHGAAQAETFRAAAPVSPAAFAHFLTRLGELAGPRLLRIKGLVATSDAPERPWLVQGAQHTIAPPLRLAQWPPGPRESVLVAIGEEVGPDARRLWDALTGTLAPDAPDWTSLADNPLAPDTRRGLLG